MDKIRVGIFGGGRGVFNSKAIMLNDAEVVAVCESRANLLERAKEKLGKDVTYYTDFDAFIQHDMDAVYIANYFNEHVPYAIKALERGIHVISECTAAGTMAECVQLVRAAEKSKAIYMLAENYPYMMFNQEMQRVYQSGKLGPCYFGEGEYNHPSAPTNTDMVTELHDSVKHWRYYLPATYYITHALGPLMCATHANPVRVTAFPVHQPRRSPYYAGHSGEMAVITCLNDDNSVFRVTACSNFGIEENSYRLACEKGQIENTRGHEVNDKVTLQYNWWDTPKGEQECSFYKPIEDPTEAGLSAQTGHAGGDFYMFKEFFSHIKNGTRPYLDVYVATTMSAVGILAHRSLLKLGEPFDVPDFRKEADRVKYENDTATPFWGQNGEAPTEACSSVPDYEPDPENVERVRKLLEK